MIYVRGFASSLVSSINLCILRQMDSIRSSCADIAGPCCHLLQHT